MTPAHVIATLREFGRSAGLRDLSLNGNDAAAIRFASGSVLRFEYGFDTLTVVMTVPCVDSPEAVRRILEYSRPSPRGGVRPIRAGYLAKNACAIFAIRLPEAAVTHPAVSEAFSRLWAIASEFGGPQ